MASYTERLIDKHIYRVQSIFYKEDIIMNERIPMNKVKVKPIVPVSRATDAQKVTIYLPQNTVSMLKFLKGNKYCNSYSELTKQAIEEYVSNHPIIM